MASSQASVGDELEYSSEELDRYFDMSHLHGADDDDDEEEILTDGSESDHDDDDDDESDEQVLSQTLSQLSTQDETDYESSTTTTTTTTTGNKRRSTTTAESMITSKKSKHGSETFERDPVPTYLSTDNETFRRALKKMIGTTKAISIDALRQVALCIHHIGALQIQKQISLVYLQSGTGEWSEPEFDLVPIDRRVWPSQVTSALAARVEMTDDEAHLACEQLVQQRLRDFDESLGHYQRQLDELMQEHPDALRQAIDGYVDEHGMALLRMKRDLKIALLEYAYHAEIVDRKYRQANPNAYQVGRAMITHSLTR
jgi:hypothetical protein